MPLGDSQRLTGCGQQPALFQHPLLEQPPRASAPAKVRRQYRDLERAAQHLCGACPLQPSCLYDAVVRHDVAGFVAGSTPRERAEVRRRLGVTVQPEDFDTLAGVVGGYRQVDHDEVVRLRRANPPESLDTLARRLGCSLSTVKRHLRRERAASPVPDSENCSLPDLSTVLAAFAEVVETPAAERRTAA